MEGGWSSEGLRRIAELVQLENDRISQKVLATKAKVSPATISNLLLNLHNSNGRIVKEPKLETLAKIAPHVTNPDTGQPFTPQEFFSIATDGFYNSQNGGGSPNELAIYVAPQNPGLQWVRAAQGSMTLKEFAQRCELSPEVMGEILEGRLPTKMECMFIAAEIDSEKNTRKLMEAYGYRFKNDSARARKNGVSS